MITPVYIRPSVRTYYEAIKQQYPAYKSRNCEGTLDIVGNLLSQAKQDLLYYSSAAARTKVDALEMLYADHAFAWGQGSCNRKKEQEKIAALNKIIKEESAEYDAEINAQTEHQKKVILFIGASAFIVGLFIILRN